MAQTPKNNVVIKGPVKYVDGKAVGLVNEYASSAPAKQKFIPSTITNEYAKPKTNVATTTAGAQIGKAITTTQKPTETKQVTPSATKTSISQPNISGAEADYQKQLKKAIEKSYQEGTAYLGGQEARLQALQPQLEQQIATTYESQLPEIQRLAEEGKMSVQQQQEQTKAERESALATARRQFEEAQQKGQQLFGGVAGSSAGLAQSEILGRELLKQTGEIGRTSQANLNQLNQALRNIETQFTNQKTQLNLQKQDALLKARDQFRTQLDTIGQQRFQLGQDKANQQLQALQDFNARRRQLEDFYTQQEANLETYRKQQEIGLQSYAQQLSLAQQYTPTTTQGVGNLSGLNLELVQMSNPTYASQLANEIAKNPQLLTLFKGRVNDKNELEYVTTTGNLKTIPLTTKQTTTTQTTPVVPQAPQVTTPVVTPTPAVTPSNLFNPSAQFNTTTPFRTGF